jgi:hypothetical protein
MRVVPSALSTRPHQKGSLVSEHNLDDLARPFGKPVLGRRAAIGAGIATALRLALGHDRRAAAGVGCRNIGKPCRRGGECCSGVCRGKSGQKSCRAHHAGTCRPGEDHCREGFTAVCNNGENCYCVVTTGGAPFCGQLDVGACTACRRDADCAAQGFPIGSACIRMTGEFCPLCPALGFTSACIAPCGTEPTALLTSAGAALSPERASR